MMFDLYLKRPRGVDLCERECERVSATVAATVADEVVRGEVSAGRTWKFVAPCGLCRLRPAPLASGLPLWQRCPLGSCLWVFELSLSRLAGSRHLVASRLQPYLYTQSCLLTARCHGSRAQQRQRSRSASMRVALPKNKRDSRHAGCDLSRVLAAAQRRSARGRALRSPGNCADNSSFDSNSGGATKYFCRIPTHGCGAAKPEHASASAIAQTH